MVTLYRACELLGSNTLNSLSEICKSVIEIFWNKVFMVGNTLKNGQS